MPMKCPKCGQMAESDTIKGQRHCVCKQCGTFRIPEGLDNSAKGDKQVPLWRQKRDGAECGDRCPDFRTEARPSGNYSKMRWPRNWDARSRPSEAADVTPMSQNTATD